MSDEPTMSGFQSDRAEGGSGKRSTQPALSQEIETCPGCQNATAEPDGRPSEGFEIAIGDDVYRQDAFSCMRCPRCGLVYKSVVLSPERMSQYYAAVNFRKWEIEGLFPTEEVVISYLCQLPHGSNILDIGCSSGRLLGRLTADYQCYGIELNEIAAGEAARRGIQMLPVDYLESSDADRFDAIVLVDVFEHLFEPVKLLAAAVQRLRPEGRLVICTGDADAPALRNDLANSWYCRNVEHVVMMTGRFSRYLENKLGLQRLYWTRVSHYESTYSQRFGQWYRSLVFDALHLGKHPFLAPLLKRLPGGKKAALWKDRPQRSMTKDHVVVVYARE